MLTYKDGQKRPASSNPKLPSIHSPVSTENNDNELAENIKFIPVKAPNSKWQDHNWPPPLNLSPLKHRRNSDTRNFQEIKKGENEAGLIQNKAENKPVLMKRKSYSAKSNIGRTEDLIEKNVEKCRQISEINFLEIKSDLDRLKKDKRIMATLLKQSQKELTKKESKIKELIQENEQLKKETSTLQTLASKLEENSKNESVANNLIILNNENKEKKELQTVDNNDKINLAENEKRITLLKQENQILKDCLNSVYCKILPTDSLQTEVVQMETKETLENSLIPITLSENSEDEIDKINEYVQKILQEHDKFTKKFKMVPQTSTDDSNEKIKSVEEHNEKLMQEVGTKENEIKSLSELNEKLKDSVSLSESRYEDLEREIVGLQLDNSKLEEFLLVCRKAHKELRSTVISWEEKYITIDEEKCNLEKKVEIIKSEFENFKMNIMETVRLALDIEPLESTVPADVLTMAIVEMAEECHALRTTVERIEKKESEQIQQLHKLYSYILETEKKLENDGRKITDLQNVICKLSLIAIPNINLEEAIIKIYSNNIDWESNILNKLSALGIPTEDETDVLDLLDSAKSNYSLQKKHLNEQDMQVLLEDKNVNKDDNTNVELVDKFNTNQKSYMNENNSVNSDIVQCNNLNNDVDKTDIKITDELPLNVYNKSEAEKFDISKELNDKFYHFISSNCDSNVSTDLLYELVENSNRNFNNKIKSENSIDMKSNSIKNDFSSSVKENSNIVKSKNEENIANGSQFHLEFKNEQENLNEMKEIHEDIITKDSAKQEEAVPYNTGYSFSLNSRDIGIQVYSVQTNEIGTQVEESDIKYFYGKELNKNKIDIGLQTNLNEESIPEKLQELELTVAEMEDVKKQHMNVACDMADKLNIISLRENELKTKLKKIEEEKIKELELFKIEWNKLENKYKEEILAWQDNAEKQNYVIHQLQIHFEQAQHLIYEKDMEIAELQRIISVYQEKIEYDRNASKMHLQINESEIDKERNLMENPRYKIMPEDILKSQIQHLNEQLEATKLCLKTSKSETAKCYQKEIEYYNDIIQKKENHVKRLQTENAQFRAGVEGKEAVILKQRKEIRQFSLKLQKLEKDIQMKDEIIRKLKNSVDYNISQTEQEKLSTIGTRCLEERHQQRLEEFQNRICQIEDDFYSSENSKENFDVNPLMDWKYKNHSYSTGNLEVIQEQPFNEIFLYDTIKQCEETYLNLINTLAHSLGITELEGAISLAVVPHLEWNTLISERQKDHKRFINAIEILKTLAENELVDQEEQFRNMENQLHLATLEINRLKEENKLKTKDLKEAEKILKLTRRSLERERLINLAIKQNRKKLEQLTAKIILQKEDDMLKVEENIKKKRKEISKTEEKLENIESKLAKDAKVKKI